jgi:recombination protein RecT
MVVKTENLKNNLQAAAPVDNLSKLIEKSVKEFKRALPVHMRAERLVRIALTCVRQTPELTQCTPESFVGALLVSAQLGLEPVAGRAYILPFYNSKTKRKEAQFIEGYRGLVDLFYRHANAVGLYWGIVHKGDEFSFCYGLKPELVHRPALTERGEVVAYWVRADLKGGAQPFLVMSKDECLEHGKKHSKTYLQDKWDEATRTRVKIADPHFAASSPWNTDPDAMCLKTVLIQLCKLLPLSIELQKAIQADETSREYREGIGDILDIQPQPWNEETQPAAAAEESQVVTGTITAAQMKSINEVAKALYGDKFEEKLINRVGSEYGLEKLPMISTEQAADLLRNLTKERANDA